MHSATTLLSRVAIVPMRRLPTTTIARRGVTIQLPTATTPRHAATIRLPTETIRRPVPTLRLRLTPLRAATLRLLLAPLVVDLAADSTVVAVADPTAAVAVVVARTAAVAAAPMVAVVVTNADILQSSRSPLRLTRSGLFLLSPSIYCPFRNPSGRATTLRLTSC